MADHQDFKQTAIPYMDIMRNYALHLTMNSENAKDLVQETYLKAYRSWSQFEQGTNIKAWLHKIMKNSYINIYRNKIKEPKKMEFNEKYFLPQTDQILSFKLKNFKCKAYNELFADEIVQSIDSLPDIFRAPLLLSDVEGLSYEEIAVIADCPTGTVRSRLHRGRKELQKKLFTYARNNNYISWKKKI